jgi:hypothetical protein
MGGYVTGFDTISYYVPVTWKWINYGIDFWEFFGSAPLFYLLLSSLTLAGVPLIVLLKILPPVLYGLLGFAIFTYATKSLAWSLQKSLFASLLATMYFIGLRISWDMLRSVLGLIFFFAFLILLGEYLQICSWKLFTMLSLSSVLVVFSHQLISVLMFAVVLTTVLEGSFKRNYAFLRHILLAILPAAVLFSLTAYADYMILPSLSEDIVAFGELNWRSLLGHSSLLDGVLKTVGFMLFCYIPLAPFILMGIKKCGKLELKSWLVWSFIGVMLPLFFSSAPIGYRWTVFLVFPFAFFAVEGFMRSKIDLLKVISAVFTALLSVSFIFLPAEVAFPYLRLYPYYVPSSMLQNSVPLSDCADVVKALSWAKANVKSEEGLLVHDAFYGWALLYAGDVKILRYGYAPPEDAALAFARQGYKRLYLIWWVSGAGWHGTESLPLSFEEVFRSGRIAIYEFKAAD